MEQPAGNPALERLDALVGEWRLEAEPPGSPPWPGEGRVSFEWLEGRTFLIERWTIELPEAPDGIAIIGAGDQPDTFRQHYFDSRGVHRIYEMTLDEGEWKLWRDEPHPFPQRYVPRHLRGYAGTSPTPTARRLRGPDGGRRTPAVE